MYHRRLAACAMSTAAKRLGSSSWHKGSPCLGAIPTSLGGLYNKNTVFVIQKENLHLYDRGREFSMEYAQIVLNEISHSL